MEQTLEQRIKWADKAVADKKVIQIVGAKKEYHVIPYYITPREDSVTKDYLLGCEYEENGEEPKNGEKVRAGLLPIAKEMLLDEEEGTRQIPITHLQRLTLANKKDAVLLYLILTYPELIAFRKEEINPATHHFYIKDEKRENLVKKNHVLDKVSVIEKLKKIPIEDLAGYFRLIRNIKPIETDADSMLTSLIIMADEDPKSVSKVLDDANVQVSVFVAKLLNKGIVKHDKFNKGYYNGE